MKNTIIKSKKGFTIIEVVLVLAIAGLIFLMVFVALPNLQRTQRDTQRRNDVDRVSTSLTQYITNNNSLPSGNNGGVLISDALSTSNDSWDKFAWNYLLASGADDFEDPNGTSYGLRALKCTNSEDGCAPDSLTNSFGYLNSQNKSINAGVITIATSASCTGSEDNVFAYNSGTRKFAVAMKLEGNGVYCVDNQ